MNLRGMSAAALTLPLVAQSPAATSLEALRGVVQDFYYWYPRIASLEQKGPAFAVALKRKGHLFSPELAQALKDDADAKDRAQGEAAGIDWDPFLNGQPPEKRYEIGAIHQIENQYFVYVHGLDSGQRRSRPVAVAVLTRAKGQWVFVDFLSAEGRSLAAALKSLRANRQLARQ